MHTPSFADRRRAVPFAPGLALMRTDALGCAECIRCVVSGLEQPGWPVELAGPAGHTLEARLRMVVDAIARTVATFGREVAVRLGRLLREISDDTLWVLADGNNPKCCLDDLASMLEYVPDTNIVRRILDNRCLRARRGRIPNLLADFAGSDLSFANADTILGALASGNATAVYGRCFEVRAAAYLKGKYGVSVRACDRMLDGANTDLLDTNGVLYQCKAYSQGSYVGNHWKLRAWCDAAVRRTADPAKVKWVVPQRRTVPARFLAYLRQTRIEVLEVPFFW